MDSYFGPLLFGFGGRINRGRYWMAVLAYTSMMIAVVGLGFFFQFHLLFMLLAALVLLILMVSGVAVGTKRLHDRDKSGWWLLLFYLAPPMLNGLGKMTGVPLVFGLASFAVSIWALIELGFLRGTSGPNQYGPDPLDVR